MENKHNPSLKGNALPITKGRALTEKDTYLKDYYGVNDREERNFFLASDVLSALAGLKEEPKKWYKVKNEKELMTCMLTYGEMLNLIDKWFDLKKVEE